MRAAASATRQLLAMEAAKLLQAGLKDVAFEDGRVTVAGRETDLTAWTLAAGVDLGQDIASHMRPKRDTARQLIGTSLPRRDLAEKAAGAPFIHDLVFNGMLHGRVLSPPSPHRRIVAFDEAAFRSRHPDVTLVRDGSFLGVATDREADAVAAITTAARLATWSADASGISDMWAALEAADASEQVVVAVGDELADGGGGVLVETTIRKPFTAHASIAPSCAIARWDDGNLEVISHTQGVHGVRDALAMALSIPAARIIVRHAPGAGTYGHSGQDDVCLDAALIAQACPGRNVRVLWDRAADF